jgi:putative sigma-54 modulation protein
MREAARAAAYTRVAGGTGTIIALRRPTSDRRPLARRVRLRTIVKGKNAEIPDRVREYAERKLKRIDRLLDDQTDATVELWNERHKSAAASHMVEVTLIVHGQVLRSRATGASYQEAIDDVVDKAERMAVVHKEKPRLRARPEEEKQILRRLADGSEGPRSEPQVVKVKRFAIEPMFEEDALAAMAELGHQFFVFVNAETERVAILYQRHDGDFGLIEPVIGGDYTKGRSRAPSAPERASPSRT